MKPGPGRQQKGTIPIPLRYGAGHKRRQWQSRRAERMMVHVCNPSNLDIMVQRNDNIPPTGFGPEVVQMDAPNEGVLCANSLCAVALVCYPVKEYEYTKKTDVVKKPILDAETWAATVELAGMRAACLPGQSW